MQARSRRTHRTLGMRWALTGTVAAVALSGLSGTASAGTPATRVTLTPDATTVRVVAPIVISGSVAPVVRGSAVYLQRYVAGHWVDIAHQFATHYHFSVKAPAKPTTWILRVERPAKTDLRAGVSHTVHVAVSSAAFKVRAAAAPAVTSGQPLVVTGSVSPRTTGAVQLQVERGVTWHMLATARLTTASTFTLSAAAPAGAYKLRVVKPFTAKIATGVSATQTVAVVGTVTATPPPPPPLVTPDLSYGTAEDTYLGLPGSRLVFSAVQGQALPPAQTVTLTDNGTMATTVSGLAISGADATSYGLAAGQPTSVTVPAGGTATVSVAFHPTAPTNCPTTANPYSLGVMSRNATLTFASSDPALPTGTVTLGGIVGCGDGGADEPVLHQIVQAAGYTTVVDTPSMDPRFLQQQSIYPGTDEISSPYFTVADPSLPVSIVPLAHYSSAELAPYHATGWYAKGAALPTNGSCNASCQTVFAFPADPADGTYNQNQKLLPTTTTGATSFRPAGAFGLFAGDGSDVVFSDDSLNLASYPHDMRVYPAYGPGHSVIANSYLVAIDTGRASESKNGDYQDIVLLVSNVVRSS